MPVSHWSPSGRRLVATGLGAALADAVYGAIGAFGVTGLIQWLLGLKVWLGLGGGARKCARIMAARFGPRNGEAGDGKR